MPLLQLLRSTLLFVAIVTTLCASTASADVNSTSNTTARHLQTVTDWRTTMLDAVNKERVAVGLPRLCMNNKLQVAAQAHSKDMALRDFVSHTGSDGSTLSTRVQDAGYRWTSVAENIAAGQLTVGRVMTSWMNSAGHRANILSARNTMLGCEYAGTSNSRYKYYWTQVFASGSTEACG
ncbi:Cysteine-rich secretory protein family [Phytophthora infestans]|nr:Cysteine-rich secretory protein family [Phytophthora infestans]